VTVSSDGSVAAFVPAKRALSWQLTDAAGTGVVRERYWVTFQPGEVRVCGSCHGLNDKDQAGQGVPNNAPKALLELLKKWKIANP
jgi:mono/diheme cytochrome c family protein